jgi:hypothetical protein
MNLVWSLFLRHAPPARLKRRLDQAPNAIMKTSALGFTSGIPVAVLLERSRSVTMAAIRNLHSSHGLTSLSPARDRIGRMLKARADLTTLLSCIYLAPGRPGRPMG